MKQSFFDKYDIDPLADSRTITETLRDRIEAAESDSERAAIRTAWEELTVHPQRRLEEALDSHPQSHPPLGRPPKRPKLTAQPDGPLTSSDLRSPPRLSETLGVAAKPRRVQPIRPEEIFD